MIAAEAARALVASEAPSYLAEGRGLRSWLLTFDHKRIGVMYLVAIGSALLLGGVFAGSSST